MNKWDKKKFLNDAPPGLRVRHRELMQELVKIGEIDWGNGKTPTYHLNIPTKYSFKVKILGVYSNGKVWIDFRSDKLKNLPEYDLKLWEDIVKSQVGIDAIVNGKRKVWREQLPILHLAERIIGAAKQFKEALNK